MYTNEGRQSNGGVSLVGVMELIFFLSLRQLVNHQTLCTIERFFINVKFVFEVNIIFSNECLLKD